MYTIISGSLSNDVFERCLKATKIALLRAFTLIAELRSFRLRVVSPTVGSPTVRVDSPTSHMSVRLRVKTCVTTVYSSTTVVLVLRDRQSERRH